MSPYNILHITLQISQQLIFTVSRQTSLIFYRNKTFRFFDLINFLLEFFIRRVARDPDQSVSRLLSTKKNLNVFKKG